MIYLIEKHREGITVIHRFYKTPDQFRATFKTAEDAHIKGTQRMLSGEISGFIIYDDSKEGGLDA